MKSPEGNFFERHRLKSAWPALVIVAAVWFIFSPVTHGSWLWDDNTEIVNNADLRGPAALWKIWFAPTNPDYFPVKTTVQWLQWQLWHDQSTVGYHLSNIGLHALGALLLWRVLRKLGVRYAWVGGLLFAIHPSIVESVAWIAELKNVLSLPLLLLALSAYLDFDERRRRVDYIIAISWFVVAMLSKSSVVMFPCFLLLHAWWKHGRITTGDLKMISPFFAVSLILGLVTVWFQQHRAIDDWEIQMGSLFDRVVGAGRALGFYAFKSIWPLDLLPIYPPWHSKWLRLLSFMAWAGLGATVAWMWLRRASFGRHILLALGWFALNLLPVLGLIKMSYLGVAPVADHFVYLSIAGLAGILVAGGEFFRRRFISLGIVPLVLIFCLCSLLAWRSRSYASVFVSQETVWSYTLDRNPGSWIAHNNLGVVYQQQEKWASAASQLEAAVAINSRYVPAHINLGNTYAHLGRWPEAEQHYVEALRLEPASFDGHFDYANILVRLNRLPEAIDHFESALRISPGATDARFNLANAFLGVGRVADALKQYDETLRYKPDSFEAHLNLGNVLAATHRMPEAISHFETAVKLVPDSTDAHFAFADALAQSGRLSESVDQYVEALRLSPNLSVLHTNLGHVLLQLGQKAQAIRHYEEALRLEPNDQEAREGLRLARSQ
jgi:tetratricopeptide (TPR) repeat protein